MKRHSMRWGADGKLPENGVVIPDNKKVVPQSQPQEQPKVESSNQQEPVARQPSPPPSPQPAEPSSSTNPELLTNENADDMHGLSPLPVCRVTNQNAFGMSNSKTCTQWVKPG